MNSKLIKGFESLKIHIKNVDDSTNDISKNKNFLESVAKVNNLLINLKKN